MHLDFLDRVRNILAITTSIFNISCFVYFCTSCIYSSNAGLSYG